VTSIPLRQVLHSSIDIAGGFNSTLVSGITSDSRDVKPGYLFVALAGTKLDGSTFIDQAIAAGASAVLTKKGTYKGTHAVFETDNPHKDLAFAAASFYGDQPETIVAVTGTNGKTSVSVFVRQIWEQMGFRAASLGTVGVVGPRGSEYVQHTTPDPVRLHELVSLLRHDQVRHLAIEASSHGLAQYRLDGLNISAGAFTNITRDHLDYHGTENAYLEAKLRLFGEVLPPGATAVLNADAAHFDIFEKCALKRGLRVMTVGRLGKDVHLKAAKLNGFSQELELLTQTAKYQVTLPLAGKFQVENALVAVGLVIAAGGDEALAIHALESLKGAPGRLDFVAKSAQGAHVFVDYAHTPDAMENALLALRPYVTGRLIIVFGCGGDRDQGKRPLMGTAASRLADTVIVTDDNPRTEDPVKIRRAILEAAPLAIEVGDRKAAIAMGVGLLKGGDVLLIAGKGHEEGQVVGTTTLPFSDHDVVRKAIQQAASNA
jgi:UDP-N-acetylmuramoyl-L-alanyl-D-glutamate--2,6-diaminopimelate ligase